MSTIFLKKVWKRVKTEKNYIKHREGWGEGKFSKILNLASPRPNGLSVTFLLMITFAPSFLRKKSDSIKKSCQEIYEGARCPELGRNHFFC